MQVIEGIPSELLLHYGNGLGEIYIYQVDYNKPQVLDGEGNVVGDNLLLRDMILTANDTQERKETDVNVVKKIETAFGVEFQGEPLIVRNSLVTESGSVICTNEMNKL